jgi:hypothetical protein
MVNASMLFTEPRLGTSVNLLYRKIGRRLDAVGRDDTREVDIYEEPRDVWDLAVTQKLPARLQLKFTAQDLRAADEEFTLGPESSPHPYERTQRATTYSVSVSASL